MQCRCPYRQNSQEVIFTGSCDISHVSSYGIYFHRIAMYFIDRYIINVCSINPYWKLSYCWRFIFLVNFSPKTSFGNTLESSPVEMILVCFLNTFLIRKDKNNHKMQHTTFLPSIQRVNYTHFLKKKMGILFSSRVSVRPYVCTSVTFLVSGKTFFALVPTRLILGM